tara:strand:+ start:13087 stop:13386 length:300 start_codon:yes stop_codon:yes gene_type:complete
MCGSGGGGGGSNAASLALQRQSLALSREQFEESKRQWGKQMEWQKQKSDEQKRAAEARPGKGPVRTADYAAPALGDRSGLGFGKDRLKRQVQGTGLGIT